MIIVIGATMLLASAAQIVRAILASVAADADNMNAAAALVVAATLASAQTPAGDVVEIHASAAPVATAIPASAGLMTMTTIRHESLLPPIDSHK